MVLGCQECDIRYQIFATEIVAHSLEIEIPLIWEQSK